MANPFTKAWKYMMALFSSKVDEYADPKVQIQQAIEEAQRQHQALTQQAASVIGNQRQIEMKMARAADEVGRLQASARQSLVLADQGQSAYRIVIADDASPSAAHWPVPRLRRSSPRAGTRKGVG